MASPDARSIPGFAGESFWPGDVGYDDARAIWNGMHDRRPAVVARCGSPADVAAAIAYGRANELPIAIRGGGHSLPGHSVCDDGIVLDLRGLSTIAIDTEARRVRVGGGALLGDLDRALAPLGFVVPAGVVSHTGVGGLTLGGGVGRLMRRYGLTIDSLVEAEVVTADGDVVVASEQQRPDLFWGLRGGGGNFGVVTAFTFALREVADVLVLTALHSIADGHGALAQAHAAVNVEGIPDELAWNVYFRVCPPLPWIPAELVGRAAVFTTLEWTGERAAGERLLAEFEQRLAASTTVTEVIPFVQLQAMNDEIFGHGIAAYQRAAFISEVSDGLADALLASGGRLGSPLSQIELLAMGGAVRHVNHADTAFPHRAAGWLINVPAAWHGDLAEAEIAWTRASSEAIAPYATGGAYVNFMEGDEEAVTEVAYGETLERLRRVKGDYDPHNVFRLNANIEPLKMTEQALTSEKNTVHFS